MGQRLVIQESFYNSAKDYLSVLESKGYKSVDSFFSAITEKLNEEYDFLNIDGYRFSSNNEKKGFSQYGAFIEGDDLPYKKIIIFFTPLSSKQGNVIIEQSFMPTVCKQMELDISFLINDKYKKIALLTSKINSNNEISVSYNKLQMDINSLNTMNFDVIPFFAIKNLSTDSCFDSLTEYLEMSDFLQEKATGNSQVKLMQVKNGILYGNCEKTQIIGEFHKSFCFRFLTAIFAGKNNYKYDIESVLSKLTKLDNQFGNLKRFVNYANTETINTFPTITIKDEDIVEGNEILVNIDDIHRQPVRSSDSKGKLRYKTQKRIRDIVLENSKYLCNCNDSKHVYFESVELHNYVEGHHIIPMNRQEEYYSNNRDEKINLDVPKNIVALCPNCHSQIHLGSRSARLKIISELYERKKADLKALNSDLSLPILASYYNIGLEEKESKIWEKYAQRIVTEKKNN